MVSDQPKSIATLYYRRNKKSREKVHKCPHCDYETTGPKQALTAHIFAKHTPNEDKPFFCTECSKGFAQASNYEKHMIKFHNINPKVTKTREDRKPVAYVICFGENMPISKKTIARYEFYRSHRIIKMEEFGVSSYIEGKTINQKDIHYDKKKGYITYKTLNEQEFLKFQKALKRKELEESERYSEDDCEYESEERPEEESEEESEEENESLHCVECKCEEHEHCEGHEYCEQHEHESDDCKNNKNKYMKPKKTHKIKKLKLRRIVKRLDCL